MVKFLHLAGIALALLMALPAWAEDAPSAASQTAVTAMPLSSSPPSQAPALSPSPTPLTPPASKPSDQCVPALAEEGMGYTLRIMPGDLLSERLSEWATYRGYTLSWEASQYRAEGPLILDKGLDTTLETVKSAMDVNDIHLNISIYQNCVIRITESK